MNWATYSKELIDSTKGHTTKPCKLSLITQHLESKKSHCKIADRKSSRTLVPLQLWTLCFNDDAIKLIVDSATAQNLIKNVTLAIINLRRFQFSN